MSVVANIAKNRAPMVVIGGGVGGLSAAIQLAASGFPVTLLERAEVVGGKLRQLEIQGRMIDSGPTVVTMRWTLDQLFEAAGRALDDYVELLPCPTLARHAWADGSRLDLFADLELSSAAIETFAGTKEAEGYRRFCAYTERIFGIVEEPFVRSSRPSMGSVFGRKGLRGMLEFASIDWQRSMWKALGTFFDDPRLRQLFARYATYYGSSPFLAPATLNLIAHVERAGVWRVNGGMVRLAEGLARLAEELGVEIRTECEVAEVLVRDGRARGVRLRDGEQLDASAVIVNAAPQAVDEGRLGAPLIGTAGVRGQAPSLSAVTWSMLARLRGFELDHHNVFFSSDYAAEFRCLGRDELIQEPTVYVCAQDRGETSPGETERLLILVNAPPRGHAPTWSTQDLDALEERSFAVLRECGLELDIVGSRRTTPEHFEALFPATGGALYGSATHTMTASFKRPCARTKLHGLYLAGGGAHPGAGLPMVCLSGRLAALAVAEDLAKRRL